jgi:PAS domain S-box-containing protein
MPPPQPPMPMRAMNTAPLLLTGFLLLATLVVASVIFAARVRAVDSHALVTLATEDVLTDTLSTVRQTENGLRGYLLTKNPISLMTYTLAVAQSPKDLATLDAMLGHGPEAANMRQVHALVAQKLAGLAATMALIHSGQNAAAVTRINSDLNLGTMVDLRTLLTGMKTHAAARLAVDEQEANRDSWLLQVATGIAVFGTILLAYFAVRESRTQTTQLRDAEAALIAANQVLESRVAERTATLAVSEARFRILSESMPGIVYRTDAAGRTTYVNPQYCDFTGLPEDSLLDSGWEATLHPDDVAQARARRDAALAGGHAYEFENRIRRSDGVYRWFLDRAVPLTDSDGIVSAWIGNSTDIDARRSAEAAMANANAILEQRVAERSAALDRIFRLSTDILTVCDFSGRFIAVSPAWERITGYPVADALNTDFMAAVHPDDLERTRSGFERLIAGEQVALENRYRRADGSWCWLSWRGVPQPSQKLIYSVARDITADREREEQLRQSQKMEVVGQLTGGVAHDFNNLLTVIMGSLELLGRGLAGAEPRLLRRVEAASDAAQRAAALTHRLLAFSRRQPLAPSPIDVNRLLAGMSDMLHRTLGETVAIEIVSGAGLWSAMADTNQLENAVLNLAVNARDAMPAGGHLTIETENTYLDETYTSTHVDVAAGQYVMISVTDTGTGMSEAVITRVFEPFFTTKPVGQGTGLGLAQVYGFIKQSGGHASIYSEPDEGTTVRLYLPRVPCVRATPNGEEGDDTATPASGPPEPPAATTPARIKGAGQAILVVEDEPGVRRFSAEILSEAGYRVVTAASGAEAIMALDDHPDIQMLFTDVVLAGGMNGRELAEIALARRPALIVLYTTGYARNAIVHHGRLDDGVNFLGKPFTATALAEKVTLLFDAVPETLLS